jgi:anti-sigma regulatory factor (Ser/Thr protein kinase)
MVALLWDDGQVNAALELENLWNDLGWAVAFSLFCAYPEASVSAGGLLEAFGEVCGLHSSVVEVPGGWSVQRSGVQHDEPFELIQAFDVDRDAPRRARHFVVDALDCWTRSDLSSDAAIVVTELATNAVIHARSRFTVTVARTGAQVRIEVRDSSADLPTEVPPGRGSSGRGVPLVAALTADWGAYRVDDGKVVWATLGG